MNESLMKLEGIFNREFASPFMQEGTVEARVTDRNTLKLRIGPRDIEVDEHLRVIAAGTALDCPVAEE